MLRRKNTKNTLFVSAIEAHGSYSPVSESAVNSKSNIKELKVVLDTVDYTAISITTLKEILNCLLQQIQMLQKKQNIH